jgi:hypothetical protein
MSGVDPNRRAKEVLLEPDILVLTVSEGREAVSP